MLKELVELLLFSNEADREIVIQYCTRIFTYLENARNDLEKSDIEELSEKLGGGETMGRILEEIKLEGIQEGKLAGIQEGISIGEKRGEKRAEQFVIKKLALRVLKQNEDLDKIIFYTGLEQSEIKNLEDELKNN